MGVLQQKIFCTVIIKGAQGLQRKEVTSDGEMPYVV